MEIVQGDEFDIDGLSICRPPRRIVAAGTASDDEWQQKTEDFCVCHGLMDIKLDVGRERGISAQKPKLDARYVLRSVVLA